MATPHIEAKKGDFAKTVLMPGDPLRAKFIADNYLKNAKKITSVRGALGYTGEYNGKLLSIMTSGMGMPSMGIYSQELFLEYNVENIIRIGSCGALNKNVKLMDIIVGMSASTNSNYAAQYKLNGTFAPTADYLLMSTFINTAKDNKNIKVGNILTTDNFYSQDPNYVEMWSKMGVLAVEMEAAALYMNAARFNKKALCVCTVSDHLLTGEELSSSLRQKGFTEMIELSLNTAIKL